MLSILYSYNNISYTSWIYMKYFTGTLGGRIIVEGSLVPEMSPGVEENS